MAVTDSIADFITGLRNAYRAKKENVTLPSSCLKVQLTEVLKKEGFVKDFSVVDDGPKKNIHIKLRYLRKSKPALLDIQRVSRPGLRVYSEASKIPRVRSGFGTTIVSTSQGILSGEQARSKNIGGELICKVW